jgi:hypothetical protein
LSSDVQEQIKFKKTGAGGKGPNINSGNLGAEEKRNNEIWEELIAYFP